MDLCLKVCIMGKYGILNWVDKLKVRRMGK